MKTLKPHYVLAFCGDTMGCGTHRIIRPIEIMSRCGVMAGRVEMNLVQDEIMVPMAPDILVFQRQCEQIHLDAMDRYRALLPNAHFVFEVDDILSAIPDASVHRTHMTPDIDKRLAAVLTRMDAVTVTTEDLAVHMRTLTDKPVKVVPNMLGKDDLDRIDEILKQPKLPTPEVRIGWGGGIGHTGDLALMKDVWNAFGDRVKWVFLGMQPEGPTNVEFAGAVQPNQYLQALASLNLDLVIAPLEDNQFNRCKSNLRLIEAGACCYPVIASPVTPYKTGNPPVFAYADSPQQWIAAIKKFLTLGDDDQAKHGTFMRNWVERKFILDDHAEERATAWLPPGIKPFKPKFSRQNGTLPITRASTVDELERALADQTVDVLYVRPGVTVTDEQIDRLKGAAFHDFGAVCFLTNDGGSWGFPVQAGFAPIDEPAAKVVDDLCKTHSTLIRVSAAAGPAVLLRRRAINAVGRPDTDRFLEASLLEWSFQAAARGFPSAVFPGIYVRVTGPNPPPEGVLQHTTLRIGSRWPRIEPDDAAMAACRREIELAFYNKHYLQMPPQDRQSYEAWADQDEAGPRNIEAAGEYVIGFDPFLCRYGEESLILPDVRDDQWVIFAAQTTKIDHIVAAAYLKAHLEQFPDSVIVYADHDHIGPGGRRVAPDFKPNFDHHLLLGRDYVTPVMAMRGSEMRGAFAGSAHDLPPEVTLYSFVLRQAEINPKGITHLARVLGHVILAQIETLARLTAAKAAIATEHAIMAGIPATVTPLPQIPIYAQVSYAVELPPPVSIVIPTKDRIDMIGPCLATLLEITDYPEFEVIVVCNGNTPEMGEYLASITDPRVRVCYWTEDYNWSKLNNTAIREFAKHEHIVMLNDDTRVISKRWLREMIGALHASGVGAVGARLIYPQGAIQHVGVVCDKGLTGHIHKGMPVQHPGNHGLAILSHEATAVTGACLAIRRDVLAQVGWLREDLAHNFNDVALCLDLRRQGLVSVVAAQAELLHFEGVTRTSPVSDEGRVVQEAEGHLLGTLYPEPDPYWNPNLLFFAIQSGQALVGLNLDVYIFPPQPRPWPAPPRRRVLVLGPTAPTQMEMRDGVSIFEAIVQGMDLKFTRPALENIGRHDLCDAVAFKSTLTALQIDEIILTELGDMPTALLGLLGQAGVPVTYRPQTAEAVCPRRTLKPNGSMCEDGFLTGQCPTCIIENGTPRGFVNHMAWQAEWLGFLGMGAELDLERTPPIYAAAIRKSLSLVLEAAAE